MNTSGMIESGIIGRPVYSVLDDEFADTQEGTLHFQHLKNVEGGLLHLAANLHEHVEQLSLLLADGTAERESARRFVRAFTRPYGLDVAATPRVVAEVERFAAAPALTPQSSAGPKARLYDYPLRAVLFPAAIVATLVTMERSKLRAMVLRWTRPYRLIFRAAVTRAIYTYRFLRRLPGRMLRLAASLVRHLVVRPARWLVNRGKVQLHTFLVWRKG